jgi:hypothetical protein
MHVFPAAFATVDYADLFSSFQRRGIEAGAPGGGRAETTAMSASSRLYLEAGRDLCVLVVAKKERACVG